MTSNIIELSWNNEEQSETMNIEDDDDDDSDDDEYEYEYIDEDEDDMNREEDSGGSGFCRAKPNSPEDVSFTFAKRKKLLELPPRCVPVGSTCASNRKGANLNIQEYCGLCGMENHAPVTDCQIAAEWAKGFPSGITTWPADYILPSIAFRTSECAKQWQLSEEETALILQKQGWNVEAANEQRHTEEHRSLHRQRTNTHREFLEATIRESNSPPQQQEQQQQQQIVPYACGICMENFNADEVHSLGCGHLFCSECWQHYLESKFEANYGGRSALRVSCPMPTCSEWIGEQHIKKLAPALVPRFQEHCLDAFVLTNRKFIRWCPGPGCNRIAIKQGTTDGISNENTVICYGRDGCQKTFCFSCGEEPHTGACRLVEGIGDAGGGNDGTTAARLPIPQIGSKNDEKSIQLCPNCKTPIEKNGGCNHMRCKCGSKFCWLCNKDITEEGYRHSCVREPTVAQQTAELRQNNLRSVDLGYIRSALEWRITKDDEEKSDLLNVDGDSNHDGATHTATRTMLENVVQRQEEMKRTDHYSKRFAAHHQGQKFAEGQCPCVSNRAEAFNKVSGINSASDKDFLVDANRRLVLSRRILKYSYCYVYHEHEKAKAHASAAASKTISKSYNSDAAANATDDDGSFALRLFERIDLFQIRQEQLERFTEELSEVSEGALSHADRKRVIDLMEVVGRSMKALIDFEIEQTLNFPQRTVAGE